MCFLDLISYSKFILRLTFFSHIFQVLQKATDKSFFIRSEVLLPINAFLIFGTRVLLPINPFLFFDFRNTSVLPINPFLFLIFGTRVLLPVNSLLFFNFSEFYENSSFATGKFLAVFLIFQDEN